MTINQSTKLSDIQLAFSKQFQYLRLEFYKTKHGAGEGSTEKGKLDASQLVNELSDKAVGQTVTFDGELRISEFEKTFASQYGISVQVFRRSGNLWLQTTTTDSWTLDEANRKGGHSELLYHEEND